MISIRSMATNVTNILNGQLTMEEDQQVIIRYGLEVIIGAIVKGIVIFGIAFALGITGYVFVLLMTIGIFRLLSGGAHCTSYNRCLVFSTTVLILLSYLAIYTVQFFEITVFFKAIIFSVPVGLYIILKWVPIDTPNKPITEIKRKRYKILTSLYLFAWATITSLLLKDNLLQTYILISIYGIWMQFFSLSPFGVNIIANIDRFLTKFFN